MLLDPTASLCCLRASLEKQILASGTHALNHARACRLTVHRAAYRQPGVFVRSVEIFSTSRSHDALCEIDNKFPSRISKVERCVLFSISHGRERERTAIKLSRIATKNLSRALDPSSSSSSSSSSGDVRLSIRECTGIAW